MAPSTARASAAGDWLQGLLREHYPDIGKTLAHHVQRERSYADPSRDSGND